jgi:hypothetical protein
MDVIGKILGRIEHPPKALGPCSGGRFACAIPRCNYLIPGPLVVGPDRLLDLGVADDKAYAARAVVSAGPAW